MSAGREMDALIAEITGCQWGLDGLGRKALFNPDGAVFAWYGSTGELVGPCLAYFSTNDAAAFFLVDYFILKSFEFSLGYVKHRGVLTWYADFSKDMFNNDDTPETKAEARPLAICRAAYKAVMEERSHR